MGTTVRKLDSDTDYWNAIREAAACLANGGLVAFPTETVYGLGANAADTAAVARLRQVKQRPDEKPFTVHVGSRSAVDRFVPQVPAVGRRLMAKAWPGPLTLIFEVGHVEQARVIQETSLDRAVNMYHEGTIGIRYPDDRSAADLLTETRVPVVAASANPAGAPPPVDADEVLKSLDGQIDLLLDAGRTRYARPSTIVRVGQQGCDILREGVLDHRTIRRLTCINFLIVCSGNTCRSPMAEGLLRSLLAKKLGCKEAELSEKGYHVESAGTGALPGDAASQTAVEAMKARGIDISHHRSQPLDLEKIRRADYVFAMTNSHAQTVKAMDPGIGQRIQLMSTMDIEDPIGGSIAVYAQCADRIENALSGWLKEIPL